MGPKNADELFTQYEENAPASEKTICRDIRLIIQELQAVLDYEKAHDTFLAGYSAGYDAGVRDGQKFVGIDGEDPQETQ